MSVPFRVGVMQLTMEPLDEMLASARVMDEAGMDTIWLAEAYPWWRKHGMEARSSTVVSGLMARATERLTIGWGIISPFTRHPVQVAMDARVVQEAAGPGRFILGFGTSKIFLNNARMQTSKTLGPMRDAVEIVRGVLGGAAFEYTGSTWSASVPALQQEAHTPRGVPPVYVAATAPKMQALAGEIADGCLTPSITTPAFVRYTRENVAADVLPRVADEIRRRDRRGQAAVGDLAGQRLHLRSRRGHIDGWHFPWRLGLAPEWRHVGAPRVAVVSELPAAEHAAYDRDRLAHWPERPIRLHLGVVQEDLGRAEAEQKTAGPGGFLHDPRVHGDLDGMTRERRDDPPADRQPLRLARHQRRDDRRGARLHPVLPPPRVRLGEPDRVQARLVHDARAAEHLIERLHRQLHDADAKRRGHPSDPLTE